MFSIKITLLKLIKTTCKIVPFYLIFLLSQPLIAENNTRSLLAQLENTIENKNDYEQKKLNRIHYLINELDASKNSQNLRLEYKVTLDLFEEYESFIYDSAFKYVQKMLVLARKLDDKEALSLSKIKLGFTYLSSGLFKESLDTLLSINLTSLSQQTQIEYYSVLARTYYDLGDYHGDKHYYAIYTQLGNKTIDSAIHILPDNTAQYWLATGLKRMKTGNLQGAIDAFNFVVSQHKLSQHDFAISTSSLGWLYTLVDRKNDAINMLIKAAIADIKSSTKETVAFRNLAIQFYRDEDLDRAYKFIKIALENATYYNARHRKLEISEILPIIEGKRLVALEKQRKQLLNYGKITTVLIILVTLFILVIYRQLRKLKIIKAMLQNTNKNLKSMNETLMETNKIKEEYIGYFFSINSEFIERLSNFQKTINRKIISRQFDDLKNVIKPSDLSKEREKLYTNFDKIFLKLFPHFIVEFNKLFNPEDQVLVEKNKLLNTDLRIFALIRLGITDNEKIAQFLNYSVNTIYTYKTKLKHKTIVPRDEFYEYIMAIKAI